MTMDLALRRRFFAEEIQAIANLTSPALVDALATVPREAFLRPGPWLIQGEGDFGRGPRQTPDGDAKHVYHNLSVAIDAARTLFNGGPGVVGMSIDALNLRPGARVLHVGCGLGYYSAVMAHCVGPEGRVVAIEVDPVLAAEAATNLAAYPWVEVRHGDGSGALGEPFDAVLCNAGLTHPPSGWLDALAAGGRMVVPVTYAFGQAGGFPGAKGAPTIGKGYMVALASTDDPATFDARVVGLIAIYNAVGLRDAAVNDRIGEAMKRSMFPAFKRLRRDPHDPATSCWLHGEGWCLSA
jgi:protein-L-isoaspartate(D-aspartate) O-methyltransferase